MQDTWIARKIRKDNIGHVLGGTMLIIVGVATVTFTLTFFYNSLAGPFPVDLATLDQIDYLDAKRQYYVTIQAKHALKAGYFLTHRGEPSDEYMLVPVGKHILLICVPVSHQGSEYTG